MPEKLVIRVVNTQNLDQKVKPKKANEVVIYHWDRIAAALCIVAALLAGLIFGSVHFFKKPGATPPLAGEPAANPAAPVAKLASPAPEPGRPQNGGQTAPLNPAGETKPAAPQPRPTASKPTADIQAEKDVQPPQPASNADATDPAKVSILSGSIKRAQLTNGIKDEQPQDLAGSTIAMNEKGLVKVYLFMETAGLNGKVLYHDWYWKGKLIAHARIPIKSNAHAAASSKFIDRIMMGPWEVKIVDESGKVLAKTDFEVR